jgi:pyridoxine/pyridoxamine 5'-phosphate oxidase
MDEKHQIEKVRQFINKHDLAVVSTVNKDSKPESAVVGISVTDDFNLIFGTFSTSRKYANLQSNSYVSLVMGWDEGKTAQIDGIANEILEPKEIDEAIVTHLSRIPSAAKFLRRADERLFKVRPVWVRYSDLSVDPWDIIEIKF